MANPIKTIQSNIKSHTDDDLTKYALFLGGLDVTHDVLSSYDPFMTGKARIFMTRVPAFIADKTSGMTTKLKKFKHIIEYGNTAISGINDIEVETSNITGGFAGRSFDVPTIAKNNTNNITISTYEFSGRPVGELLHWWISGVSDFQSAFATYHGVNMPVKQSNHTAEFWYVVTDRTGKSDGIEFCCMFANCFPTGIKQDHLNYQSGQSETVQMDITFTCTMYDGPQINAIGKELLDKYQILMDSMDFNPKFNMSEDFGTASKYNEKTGMLTQA